jgi:hypothetical protein
LDTYIESVLKNTHQLYKYSVSKVIVCRIILNEIKVEVHAHGVLQEACGTIIDVKGNPISKVISMYIFIKNAFICHCSVGVPARPLFKAYHLIADI